MTNILDFHESFKALFSLQKNDVFDRNYAVLDTNVAVLNKLAQLGNSAISVFDMHLQRHVYVSDTYSQLFGYDMKELKKDDMGYFNSRIHPDDIVKLHTNGLEMMDFILSLDPMLRSDYKFINEYRILGSNDNFVRVIEQHQVMELDVNGNVWLALSILDLSPNQDDDKGVKSQLFNFRTGKLIPVIAAVGSTNDSALTKKEKEVLRLVKDGLLSKEISNKLSISIHTVNTHRQRILVKLDADNAMEAVKKASALGLLA